MADYVWAPISGNGQSPATGYTWNGAAANWNTGGSWINASTLLIDRSSVSSGTVPGSGLGTSQGPGQDNVTLVAGELNPEAMAAYNGFLVPQGYPYINSTTYTVDLLLNAGTVDLHNLSLAAFNENLYALPIYPTLDVEHATLRDVEHATLRIEGSIAATATAIFPDHNSASPVFGTLAAFGGGTIDLGGGATVEVGGVVRPSVVNGTAKYVVTQFQDASQDVLRLDAVSASQPSAFGGKIAGFGPGDTIDLPGIAYSNTLQTSYIAGDQFSPGYLSINDGAITLANFVIRSTSYTPSSFSLVNDGAGGTAVVTFVAAGTRIHTTHGEVLVEHFRVGDRAEVLLGSHVAPIVWIGKRHINCCRHSRPYLVWPVRIAAHAFADNVPQRDLLLSPDHSIFLNGALIPVKYLINGDNIIQLQRDEVVYYHIELPKHNVLLAEGMPVESYLDAGTRSVLQNSPTTITAHPDFTSHAWEARGCAPLVVSGPLLAAVRQQLRERRLRAQIAA